MPRQPRESGDSRLPKWVVTLSQALAFVVAGIFIVLYFWPIIHSYLNGNFEAEPDMAIFVVLVLLAAIGIKRNGDKPNG